MNVFDLFMVGIEISVAIAGFAGIVATFQFRDREKVSRGDAVGLTMIVKISLYLAFCCVLPLSLAAFGLEGPTLWTLCSIFGAVLQCYLSISIYKAMKGAIVGVSAGIMIGTIHVMGALNAALQIANISGFVFHQEPGPVIAGVVFGLTMAAFMFSRLLLRPVWKSVRENEAAALAQAQ
jgi:hypothetical protein